MAEIKHSDLLKSSKAIDEMLAKQADDEVKTSPVVVPLHIAKTLFDSQEDEFGGNENNRRVIQANKKEREVVSGKATPEELDALKKKQAAEVKAAHDAESQGDGSGTYETSKVPAGVWRPNA